jgi:GcrA cell cycle regulator
MTVAWWTAAKIEKLRQLWDTGMSASKIGVVIGKSKNSVISKAHSLHLPPRPSPIKPNGTPKSTLPPVKPYNRMETPFSAKVVVPVERIVKVPVIARSPTQCCWPIGFPKEPGFRFCSDPADFGRSYCGKHHAIAYVRRAA